MIMVNSTEKLFLLKEELSKVTPPPFLGPPNSYYDDLEDFIYAYTRDQNPKKVLVWAGLMGSGKTRFRRLAHEYRGVRAELYGESSTIGVRTWEFAERRARLSNLIKTPRGFPLHTNELNAASRTLEEQICDSVLHFNDTEIEAPVLTSINIQPDPAKQPKFVGRELGLKAFYNLAHFRGKEFSKLPDSDIWAVDIWAVGLSAGSFLREMVPPFRDGIRFAQSLREAQALAVLCGLEPPTNNAQWRMMKLDGASVEETRVVRCQFADTLSAYSKLRPYDLTGLDSTILETDILRFIFSDESNLRLDANRFFVGTNDPELPIPDKELLNEFIVSRGRMRLNPEQVSLLLDHVAETSN